MPGEVYRKEAFHGKGETFALDLSPGTQVSYWRIMYAHPDVIGTHQDRYTLRTELSGRERRYSSHDEDRNRGSILLGRLFGAGDLSLRLGPLWQEQLPLGLQLLDPQLPLVNKLVIVDVIIN